MAWISDTKGQILLIQQAAGRKLWSLPGGKVRSHEPIRQALGRELKEEVGLTVNTAEIVDVFDRPRKAALAILFRVTVRKGSLRLGDKEIMDAAYLSKLPAQSTPSARFFWPRRALAAKKDASDRAALIR